MNLPDLQHESRRSPGADLTAPAFEPIKLEPSMSYLQARAVPGAIYDARFKCMVLPVPTPRSAIVALTMKPSLANVYPELIELRDQLLVDVHPTDYATQIGLKINAPVVHQSLLDQGFDWLKFDDGATQETDLGYAAAMLRKIHGFYLGWARGYGKTLGTAAVTEANEYRLVVVVAPNSTKVDTWVEELKVRLPSHRLLVMPNDKAKRESLLVWLRNEADVERKGGKPMQPTVLITHHESARLIAQWRGPLARVDTPDPSYGGWRKLHIEWDLVAIDEGHRLANVDTKLHRGVRNITRLNTLVLSGSVYQNNWEELYGPAHVMLPLTYANKWDDWNLRHFDYVEGYGKVFAGIQEGHEQAMRDEIGVWLIVREKPDKSIHNTRLVQLTPGQRAAYDELRDFFVTELEDNSFVLAQQGIVMLQRLRQIASGLELLSDNVVDSSKLDAVVEDILKFGLERGDDFFIAGWYKASVRALQTRLNEVGIQAWVITGDIQPAKRPAILKVVREQAALRRQGKRKMPVVLIGTIPTLGESVNLQHLNHVGRIDRAFNPALNRQVIDRCDRTGQWRDVYATDYVAEDTVDDMVVLPSLANKDAVRALLLGRAA